MHRLPFSFLGAGALVLACSNLDPNDFGAPLEAVHGGQAGYSYDAGVPAAGSASRAGSGGKPGAATQPPNSAGSAGYATGSAGEAGSEGALGTGGDVGSEGLGGADDGTNGGTAGSGGLAAGASGGSSSGAGSAAGTGASGAVTGLGGRSGWGGRGGTSAGGRGGRASVGGVGGDSEHAGHGGVAGSAPPEPEPEHDLVFSEYVESGGKKALEIRAGQASSLAGCRVVTYFNGADSGSGVVLEGDVASGDVYVLCSAKLEEELTAVCDRTAGIRFNGDDALTLECGGVVIDAIGQIGVDPGTAWEANGAATLKQTLRRRCSAPSGDSDATDAFDPSVAWLPLPVDTFDGLGQPECG